MTSSATRPKRRRYKLRPDSPLWRLRQAPMKIRPSQAALLKRHNGALIVTRPDGPYGPWLVEAPTSTGILPSGISEMATLPGPAARSLLDVLLEAETVFLRQHAAVRRSPREG